MRVHRLSLTENVFIGESNRPRHATQLFITERSDRSLSALSGLPVMKLYFTLINNS